MATLASISSALTLGIPYWVVSLAVLGFLIVCIVLILTVLIQRPQGGGLSGAFGAGGGSGQTAFGAKTGDALTFATIGMFIIFLGFAIGLNFAARPANLDGAPQPQIVAPEGEGVDADAPLDETPDAENNGAAGDDTAIIDLDGGTDEVIDAIEDAVSDTDADAPAQDTPADEPTPDQP
ncbi:MAG: preprotein translocase subunit SecG [Planctomycetota bacterium]